MTICSIRRWGGVLSLVGLLGAGGPICAQPSGAELADAIKAAWALFENGDYAGAERTGDELLSRAVRDYGPRSTQVVDVLDLLLRARYRGGHRRDPETLRIAERAVRLREDLNGRDSREFATSLHWLGVLENTLGDLERSETLQLEALEIRERVLPAGHRDVVQSLYQLGELAGVDLGQMDRGLGYHERAVDIATRVIPEDDFAHSESLNRYAKLLYTAGEFRQARELYARGLEIRLTVFGPDHPRTATLQHNLGLTNQVLGDLTAAQTLCEQAWDTRIRSLGPDHPQTGSSLVAAASLAEWRGDYTTARSLYEEALGVMSESLGERNDRYAHLIHSFADLMGRTGEFDKAVELHARGLEIRRALHRDPHQDLAISLRHMGRALFAQGRLAEAQAILLEALAMQEQVLGPGQTYAASVRLSLARVKRGMGETAAARRLAEQVVSEFETNLGAESLSLVQPLTLLSELLFESGDFERAAELSRRAREIMDRVLGDDHLESIDLLRAESRILERRGRPHLALARSLDAARIARGHLTLTARAFPERQALEFAAGRRDALGSALALLAILPDAPATEVRRAWDEVVRSRALVLDEMAFRHRQALSSADPEVTRLLRELGESRVALAHLKVRGPAGSDPAVYAWMLGVVRATVDGAERELAERSLEFRRREDHIMIGLDTILGNIPADTALVSYVHYGAFPTPPRGGAPRERGYLALVLAAGENVPLAVDLGSALEIDALIGAWRREASTGVWRRREPLADALAEYRAVGAELRRRVWDPLGDAIEGAERVYVVPAGGLLLVNFAALPADEGRFLVEAGPVIHLLTTERDLVAPASKSRPGRGLLAIGGPDFSERSLFSRLRHSPERQPPGSDIVAAGPVALDHVVRSGWCGDFSDWIFPALPHAEREVRQLAGIWSHALPEDEPALMLQGPQASEGAFKQHAPGRRVLHLATHGVFFPGHCSTEGATKETRGIGGLSPIVKENPLVLSGVVLAGANHRAHAVAGEEDGILTSDEISLLDLGSTEWAVLSACDTGLGEIRIGEGVLGLRRAFRIAGARTVIMSLWSVADEPARKWMTALYTRRLDDDLTTPEAVRRATLDVLQQRRRKGKSTHPFFWAAFVAAGAPG